MFSKKTLLFLLGFVALNATVLMLIVYHVSPPKEVDGKLMVHPYFELDLQDGKLMAFYVLDGKNFRYPVGQINFYEDLVQLWVHAPEPVIIETKMQIQKYVLDYLKKHQQRRNFQLWNRDVFKSMPNAKFVSYSISFAKEPKLPHFKNQKIICYRPRVYHLLR